MEQEIYVIGLNHRTAGVEIREAFALNNCNPRSQGLITPDGPIQEAVTLSTCNRVEILAVGQPGALDNLMSFWAATCNGNVETLAPHIYTHLGIEAVEHVFTVAASLDSMVVGEPQILGQLKDAYREATKHGSAKVILNSLMHKAFSVAKRVRTETGIASSAVSISYAAVELAKKIFGSMEKNTAMLIGAGEMAELAATHLVNAGIQKILVANRTFERAEELAERFNGEAIVFEELTRKLTDVDIVISSTGAPDAIIRAKDLSQVLKKRKHRPMFFIDIAVPRDVDPDVNSLDNVYLYDIDDLKEVVEENMAQRREEALKAAAIIRSEAERFNEWLDSLSLQPTIVALLAKGEDMAKKELQKTLKRLGPDIDPETEKTLEILVTSLVKKIYHDPIVFLKRRTREEGSAQKMLDITRKIFNLDGEEIPEDAHLDKKKTPTLQDAEECNPLEQE